MQSMQSERKATKYLKSKDYENRPQLQKELNIMIRQKFSNSKYKDVYHLATIMIRLGTNAVPAKKYTVESS